MPGRPTRACTLTRRTRALLQAHKIADHLWDAALGNFVNRFSADYSNGTFNQHVSPTSFYALQARSATDAQAAAMAEGWLLNRSRFCLVSKQA